MSGGVDSAVAALEADGEAVAVTLELWRDPENDGERSCCSADAVRSARALAHRMGLAHFTLDLRDEFRAGVVDPWLAGHADGLTPNPCVGCNGHVRLDAMLEFADRLGAATLTTGHYARRTPDGLLRQAADQAKDQSYMLAALAAPRSRACASRSATTRARPRSATSRARPGCRSRARPTRRTSASSPAPGARGSSPATAPCASAPATSSTAPGGASDATAATTTSPSASGAASGSAARTSRCTCSRPTPARTP